MKLLLTGAAGIVGRAIRPLLTEKGYQLRLTDLHPIADLGEKEFFQGDIEDPIFLDQIMNDVDAVIHLAGLVGPDFTFEEVMGTNVNGTHEIFGAAERNGIKRVIYASSHHAVGFIPRGARIDHLTPPRADSFYGMSKAFGETIAAWFADHHNMDVLTIRIGYVGEEVIDERRLHTWCSPRDLTNLICCGLESENLGYRLVYGVSKTPEPFFDNRSAEEIGFAPLDHSLDHLADTSLAAAKPDPNNPDDWFVGGYFASRGFQGDLSKLQKEHGVGEQDS